MSTIIRKIWLWIRARDKKPEQKPTHTQDKNIKFQQNQPVKKRELILEFVGDLPNHICPQTVYIVGENNFYWMAGLLCPCGCQDFIHLNLLKEAKPCWKFKISKGLISISPSVWRTYGCKSHFSISKGKVIWAEDILYHI
jgi:hypothetical protein